MLDENFWVKLTMATASVDQHGQTLAAKIKLAVVVGKTSNVGRAMNWPLLMEHIVGGDANTELEDRSSTEMKLLRVGPHSVIEKVVKQNLLRIAPRNIYKQQHALNLPSNFNRIE